MSLGDLFRGLTGQRDLSETQKNELRQRVYTTFVAQDYARAEELARECCRINIANKHERLLITICLLRVGNAAEARAKLRQTEQLVDQNPWGPFEMWLERLLLDEADVDQVLKAAADDRQRCQAYYYEGARLLTASEFAGAEEAFSRCLDFEINCPETQLAKAELRRLLASNR